MTGGLVAGVDIATANVRVEVYDPDGVLVAAAARPLEEPTRHPGGRSEQDANTWWPAVRDCLGDCTAQLGSRGRDITSLAICATSGTVVLVDDRGQPVGPALMYDDRRAVAEADKAAEAGAERWRRTGITFSAGSGLARIARLVADSPREAVLACHTPDLVARQLVGHRVPTDSSHALKSGYDVDAREWAGEVFGALGVPLALLPDVVRPTTVLGTVDQRASQVTGLPVGCEVRAGMTDGCASQLACGAVETGQFVTVLGTTMVLKGVSAEPVADPTGVVYSHRHPDGAWLPGGASNVGGSALSDIDVQALPDLDAAAHARGASTVVQYPLRGKGERFPFAAETAEAFVLGEPTDTVDEYRSRLEGVAFCERLALERLRTLGAPATGPLRAAGGGARSLTWCRIRASVLGRPVLRVNTAGTALGAAMLAASGSLHPGLAAATAAMAPAGELIEPAATEVGSLHYSYERFLAELEDRGWLP